MPKFFGPTDFNNNPLLGVATAAPGTNTTQAANTAFVQAALPAEVVPLFMVQATGAAVTSTSTVVTGASLIDGTNFLWNSAYAPGVRAVFLEILASSTAGSPVVILTALGATAAAVSLTGTASTTTVRTRSAALGAALVNGTEYQVRLYNSVAGTASLKVARLLVI